MDRVHINIPVWSIRLLKDSKESLEMLACAFIIKANYQNSVMYDCDDCKKVVRLFHVSYGKAKKLIEAMKESYLFIYNGKKHALYAKTFKDKNVKVYGKKGRYEAISDYCYKLQYTEGMQLREVVRQFREILALCLIRACGNDTCDTTGLDCRFGTKQARRRAINQGHIASAIGLSRTSASRYTTQMKKEGLIEKSRMEFTCVIPHLNEETLEEHRKHDKRDFIIYRDEKSGTWSAWKGSPCFYSITDPQMGKRMKNVIHNFYYRRKSRLPQTSSEIDGEGFWSKFR